MVQIPRLTDDPATLDALSRVEVLYTDLDGTLLAPGGCALADDSGAPSTVLAQAIVDLNAAGLTVVPISGREVDQLFELTRLLGWRDFIAEAGAITVRGVRPDHQTVFNRGDWPQHLVATGEPTPYQRIAQSGAFERLVAAFPGRIEQYSSPPRERMATHLLRGCISAHEGQAVIANIDPPLDLVDNGALRGKGTLRCGDSTPHAFHLVARGVSKAGAIAADLAARGLRPDQAAAIGDSATDIAMADVVGVMVLVANALQGEGVIDALARTPRHNVVATTRNRSEGWAEFADAWLAARQR